MGIGQQAGGATAAGLEKGAINPVVGQTTTLEGAVRSHAEMMAPGAFGKILLIS